MFTKDSNILDVLESDERMVETFNRLGLKCVECVAVIKETLSDVARYHNISLDKILSELNSIPLNKDAK